jgi:hypothetical protein
MTLLLILLMFLSGGGQVWGTSTASGSASAEVVAPAARQGAARLSIAVWPNGLEGRVVRRTLRCGPPGGSLPRPGSACRRLNALRDPFAPVPKDTVCTEIYGGPQVARVRGTHRGVRVDAAFNRRNGCEIGRWNRVQFLLVSR